MAECAKTTSVSNGCIVNQQTSDLDELLSSAIAAAGPALSDRMDRDPEAHLELIARTDRAHRRLAEMLSAGVLSARSAGHSWEAIGATLGMSRQAAQQRFGKTASSVDTGPEPRRRIVTDLTAFNEMKALHLAGQYGWHSVDYGPFYHLLERDDRQWEHRRVLAWSRNRAQLHEQGWQIIGEGWFPWAYYGRPTEAEALPGDISDEALLAGAAS